MDFPELVPVSHGTGWDAKVYDASTYTEKTKEEWQAEIEKLKGYAAAGNLDPENWGTDENGNYVYDIYGEIEKAEEAYKTAPEKREMKPVEPPFPFRDELIDPFFPELGSIIVFMGLFLWRMEITIAMKW